MGNIGEIQSAMLKAFAVGTRGTTEPTEDDEDNEDNETEGNATGGQE